MVADSEKVPDFLTVQSEEPTKKLTKTGWILLGTFAVAAGSIYAIATPFVLPALRRYCLPYIPATDKQVRNVLSLLNGRTGTLIDLGSGDGRIVIEAAKNNFKSYGVELNHWLVLYSRWSSWRQRTNQMTEFSRQNLWTTDLSVYNNIVIFGVECMMSELETKLTNELAQDAVVIACRFPLPNRKPTRTIHAGIDTVWIYDRQALNVQHKYEVQE